MSVCVCLCLLAECSPIRYPLREEKIQAYRTIFDFLTNGPKLNMLCECQVHASRPGPCLSPSSCDCDVCCMVRVRVQMLVWWWWGRIYGLCFRRYRRRNGEGPAERVSEECSGVGIEGACRQWGGWQDPDEWPTNGG